MKTVRLLLVAVTATLGFAPWTGAQERLPEAHPSADEVRALRMLVEKQGREIDEMRQAIEELTKIVQIKEGVKVTPPAPAHSGEAAPAPAPSAPPAPEPPPVAPAPEPRVERAEPPATTGTQHTVAKGETLTSIAKHYNISIADLHKANKVTDDRKLQIGQVLQIPTKTAETPTEKKETP